MRSYVEDTLARYEAKIRKERIHRLIGISIASTIFMVICIAGLAGVII